MQKIIPTSTKRLKVSINLHSVCLIENSDCFIVIYPKLLCKSKGNAMANFMVSQKEELLSKII